VEHALFDGGPPARLYTWLRLRKAGRKQLAREAAVAATVTWLPLLVLVAAVNDDAARPNALSSFVSDLATHARYLVALPILILAESVCARRLGTLGQNFRDCGLVPDAAGSRFETAVRSTRALQDAAVAEVGIVLVAYAISLALFFLMPLDLAPAWHRAPDGFDQQSPAAFWHALVSLPLLLVLLLAWIWRVVCWARFLWLMSRLGLNLIASHPDRAAGLRFTGHSLRVFTLPALAMSVIVSGSEANIVLSGAASLRSIALVALGQTAFVIVLFTAPLLAFLRTLLVSWQAGVLAYGALATRVGAQLERDWLKRGAAFPRDPLDTQAFSATADLYQVVSNVYEMRLLPVDLKSVVLLAGVALLPFLPVLLLAAPLDVILQRFAAILV
jgi:hypothetical protein